MRWPSSVFLFADPGGVLSDAGIFLEVGQGSQRSGERHFIVQGMNAVMTQAADIDPLGQFGTCVVFFETRPPVQFLGNQMMKRQSTLAAAQRTGAPFEFVPGFSIINVGRR